MSYYIRDGSVGSAVMRSYCDGGRNSILPYLYIFMANFVMQFGCVITCQSCDLFAFLYTPKRSKYDMYY